MGVEGDWYLWEGKMRVWGVDYIEIGDLIFLGEGLIGSMGGYGKRIQKYICMREVYLST